MTGREYTIHGWDPEYWDNPGTWDQELVQHEAKWPFAVVDGAWVLRATVVCGLDHGQGYEVIGGRPQAIELSRSSWQLTSTSCHLLVSARPFAVALVESETGDSLPGRRLKVARQVYKGELGATPPMAKPKFAIEGPYPRRDRRSNKSGWARLTEVAAMVGLTPEQMLWDYWSFIDYEWRSESESSAGRSRGLEIVEAVTRDEIHNHQLDSSRIKRFWREEIVQLTPTGDHPWGQYWIRKGTANTILYLHHFGYVPWSRQVREDTERGLAQLAQA